MPVNNNPARHCAAVKRLLGPLPPQSFMQTAKNMVGNALGQAAFNRITDGIPKIQVKNNVNSSLRRLVDEVNSGNISFAGKTINAASRAVFTTVGINPNVVPPDPNNKTIYDRGMQAGTYLGGLIIAGAIEEADLPGPAGDLANLAYWQQNYAEMAEDITDPSCGITAYARDLIPYAPKFNYMFMVQITFQPDYADLGIQENKQLEREESIKFQYLCRRFTRPTVNVEYEDINMYNFHTKVAKKVTYEPVTMRLYDDNKNSSMVFLEKYLKSRSPVARVTNNQQDLYENRGMDFTPYEGTKDQQGKIIQEGLFTNNSASLSGLVNENRSILRRIDVYHVFNYGTRANKYSFLNPKIMQFDISDFDMDEGVEPASIEIQLAYDSMHTETDIDMTFDIQGLSKLGERYMHSKGRVF